MNKNELDINFPIEYTWEKVGERSIMWHVESIDAHGSVTIKGDTPNLQDILEMEKSIRISILSYIGFRTNIPIDKERLMDEYL